MTRPCQRRQVLQLGGGCLAALALPAVLRADPVTEVEMRGSARGEAVWFAPQGLLVPLGTTLRFVNRDPGNSHTATCYDPAILGRLRRIPAGATPWDSDFLLPDQSFQVTPDRPGVYDFYCQPHEHAGMVGRLIVGRPEDHADWQGAAPLTDDLPPAAGAAFPAVADILAHIRVSASEAA